MALIYDIGAKKLKVPIKEGYILTPMFSVLFGKLSSMGTEGPTNVEELEHMKDNWSITTTFPS
jgi:hypothetical protein